MLFHIVLTLFFAGYVGSFLYAKIAARLRIADRLNQQERNAPVGGGIVVVALFVGATLFQASNGSQSGFEWSRTFFIAFIALYYAWIGHSADRNNMPGNVKLSLQILPAASAAFLIFRPLVFPTEFIYVHPTNDLLYLKLGSVVGLCFITLSILACVHSFNALDGANGFATTLAILYAITLEIILLAWEEPSPNLIFACLALAALLAGFLVLNFPPAKLHLGNAGSLLIGFLLAALTFCVFSYNKYIRPVPIFCLWTLPAIDLTAAILRRRTQHKSIFAPDHDHIHHFLERRFGKGAPVVVALILLQIPLSAAVVISYKTGSDAVSLGAAVLYWTALPLFNLFGRNELLQLRSCIRARAVESNSNAIEGAADQDGRDENLSC